MTLSTSLSTAIEPVATDLVAPYRLDDPREILVMLRDLRDTEAVVHLSAADGNRVMSTLQSVDKDRNRLTFTGDATPEGWQVLAGSTVVTAVAFPGSVRLQIDLPQPVLVGSGQRARLDTGLPTHFYRVQRRNSFRVRTLEREAAKASFNHPQPPHPTLALRVLDLSMGGCALRAPIGAGTFRSGMELPVVEFDLDPDTHFFCGVRVHHVTVTNQGLRLGCELMRLDGSGSRALQRCIDQMQKRQRWASALI